jgi:hypothetical protein
MIAVPADDHPAGGHDIQPLHNAEVQAKIEEKLGPAFSKIRVLAKSRVNGRCPESNVPVEQACMSDSAHCCSGNDQLYETIRHSPGGIGKVNTNFEVRLWHTHVLRGTLARRLSISQMIVVSACHRSS